MHGLDAFRVVETQQEPGVPSVFVSELFPIIRARKASLREIIRDSFVFIRIGEFSDFFRLLVVTSPVYPQVKRTVIRFATIRERCFFIGASRNGDAPVGAPPIDYSRAVCRAPVA